MVTEMTAAMTDMMTAETGATTDTMTAETDVTTGTMTAETDATTDTMTAETDVMTDAVTTTIVVGNVQIDGAAPAAPLHIYSVYIFLISGHPNPERMVLIMSYLIARSLTERSHAVHLTYGMPQWVYTITPPKNVYDDGNIPDIDLPKDSGSVEPLPESSRPRKDGPGGE